MTPPATLAVLAERIHNLSRNLDEKHIQNRRDIHKMQNDIQTLTNQVWLIKLKLAGFSALGSAAGVAVVKLVEFIHHGWK